MRYNKINVEAVAYRMLLPFLGDKTKEKNYGIWEQVAKTHEELIELRGNKRW